MTASRETTTCLAQNATWHPPKRTQHVVLALGLVILLAVPRNTLAQALVGNSSPAATSGQSPLPIPAAPAAPEDPASEGSGWIGLGTVAAYLGLLTVSVGMGAGLRSPESNTKGVRTLFMVGAGGAAVLTGGLALRVLGYDKRQDAYLRTGYQPSRTMVAPWTWIVIGGTVTAGGVALAASGLASGSAKKAAGGGVIAFLGGGLAAMIGDVLGRGIRYEPPRPSASTLGSVRPWLAPIATADGADARVSRGCVAGLLGTF